MNEPRTTPEEYGGQLTRWVSAFSAGRYHEFEGALEESCTPNDVKRFLINSFGNRYSWLMREAASVARVFDDFSAYVEAYIRAVPRSRYDITGPADEERFLIWLAQTESLTPVQRDFVTCQRGEFAVGTEARRNRAAHLRFQELWKHAGERSAQFDADASMRIHLNPIRFAGELLTTTFAPGVVSLPIAVVFHAAGTSVRAALVEEVASEVLRELAVRGPCTLEEWVGEASPGRCEELLRLAGELAAQGLAAFE